ncbi:MAG: ABC transporter substrate-binding protein [Alcaligenaceae bacterium]|nr:ABC transporter substrate-binding protein [Alcaligenaceae bacterium]
MLGQRIYKKVLVAAFASALGFTMTLPAAMAATPKDTLVIAKSSDPQTLDPAITMDNNDWTVTYPAYQHLVKYKKGSTDVEGDLAESWEASADNLTWVFKLKPGHKFNDGSDVTADAVKYTFDRLLRVKQGPSEPFPADLEISVKDPLTVEFKLKTPFAPFLYILANNGAGIVNPAVEKAEGGADKFLAGNTAGSGPYQLSKWDKSQAILLERNPHYGGDKPVLDKVLLKIIPDASAQRLQLQNGDLDIVAKLPVDQIEALKSKPGVHFEKVPSLLVTYLYLNNKTGPLSDVNARKGISEAIDYQGIVEGVLNNQGKQLKGPIPDGMWAYDDSNPDFKQNLDAAKASLAKANLGKQSLTLLYSNRDANWEPIALTVQANLAALGVDVKLEKLANATMRDRLGKGDFDIALGNWSPDFADPFMFMNYWFDSEKGGLPGNRSFYSNPEVDKLVRKAAEISDQAERTKLYQEAQKQVLKDYAYVYLFQKSEEVGLRDNVKGYSYNPMLDDVYNVRDISKE